MEKIRRHGKKSILWKILRKISPPSGKFHSMEKILAAKQKLADTLKIPFYEKFRRGGYKKPAPPAPFSFPQQDD